MSHCLIKASLTRCRGAWLDEKILSEWLADAANIRDSDYILTSRLPNVSGRHSLVKQHDHFLQFGWFVDGCETDLTVNFRNSEGQTWVEVTHKFPSPTPIGVNFPAGKHYGDQVWSYALKQLKYLLEKGAKAMTLPWPDNAHQIEHEIIIQAPASKIWKCLVDAGQLRKLSLGGTDPVVEPKVGGRYSFGWVEEEENKTDGPGHIIEWEEFKKLSHTWYGGRDSVISWELDERKENVTVLSFKHNGLIFSYPETWSYKLGWAHHMLEMKTLLEKID